MFTGNFMFVNEQAEENAQCMGIPRNVGKSVLLLIKVVLVSFSFVFEPVR